MPNFLQPLLLVISILGFTKPLFAVDKPVLSGSFGRKDIASGTVNFTIKVANVSKAQTTSEKDLLKDRIRFWLTNTGSSGTDDYVRYEGETQGSGPPFYWTGTLDQKDSGTDKKDFTWTIKVYETDHNAWSFEKLKKEGGGSLKLKIQYLEDLKMQSEEPSAVLAYTSAIVKSAPTGLGTTGDHKVIVASWSIPSSAEWSDASVSGAPTGVTVLAIDKTTTHTDLPAFIYDSQKDTDAEATANECQYNPDFTDGQSCITCQNTNAYLNSTKLAALNSEGIFIKENASASGGEATVTGLENGKNYAVVAFFEPGGLQRSVCLTASPEQNSTYSETNGESEAELLNPKCFVATAAYGSKLHKNLKPLRWFRDQVLLQSKWGTSFVDWYYEHGPKAAKVVAASPALQLTVQGLLWLPVLFFSALMALGVTGGQATFVIVLAAVGFAWTFRALNRRRRQV